MKILKSKESLNGGFPDTQKMIKAFLSFAEHRFDVMAQKSFDIISDKYFYKFIEMSKDNLFIDDESRK